MKKHKITIHILAVSILLIVASCRTLPPPPEYDIASLLPEECNLVIHINVPGNEELLSVVMDSIGLEPEKAEPVLKRTLIAAIGLEMDGAETDFRKMPTHAAAVGIWPRGIMGNVLGKEWERVTLKRFLWKGPEGREVYAVSKGLVLMSQGRMDYMGYAVQAGGQGGGGNRDFSKADVAIQLKDADYISHLIPRLKTA